MEETSSVTAVKASPIPIARASIPSFKNCKEAVPVLPNIDADNITGNSDRIIIGISIFFIIPPYLITANLPTLTLPVVASFTEKR